MLGFQALVVSALVSSSIADEVSSGDHAPHSVVGAGGYARAWDDHWKDKEKRETRKRHLLALIRSSDEYRRLKRKLAMLGEHLLDASGSRVQTIKVNEKIAEIESQIEMMERLE
jgi:hypothetical protein